MRHHVKAPLIVPSAWLLQLNRFKYSSVYLSLSLSFPCPLINILIPFPGPGQALEVGL